MRVCSQSSCRTNRGVFSRDQRELDAMAKRVQGRRTPFLAPGIMERAGRGEFGMSAAEGYGIFPRALLEIFGRMKGEPVGEPVDMQRD